jgi:hypothetical protein
MTMTTLKFVFRENGPDHFPKVDAVVALDPYQTTSLLRTPMPALTRECDVFSEFDAELRELEAQIASIRAEAKRRFAKAGILL